MFPLPVRALRYLPVVAISISRLTALRLVSFQLPDGSTSLRTLNPTTC